jgi:hypothetical protein
MAPKILHGGRVLVQVDGQTVGIFHNMTWNRALDTQDAFILGKMSVAEIGYTAQEPISGSLTGWKIVGHGAHSTDINLTRLQDMLTADYTTLTLVDRVTGKRVGVIRGVRLTGESGGYSTRQMSEISIPFKGMLMDDEDMPQDGEGPSAADLP